MKKEEYSFSYQVYDSIVDIEKADADLLEKARTFAMTAYAPYSSFLVGASAILDNGKIVCGTNQENASYPVGICAERSLLATAAALYPDSHIVTMAVTYKNLRGSSVEPVSPCGMCRQALLEHETRYGYPIKLILSGSEGPVFILERAALLLPLSFKGEFLKE